MNDSQPKGKLTRSKKLKSISVHSDVINVPSVPESKSSQPTTAQVEEKISQETKSEDKAAMSEAFKIPQSILVNPELTEVKAYGLVMGIEKAKPIMLFKGNTDFDVFPVWLTQIETSLFLSESSPKGARKNGTHYHRTTLQILESLNSEIVACEFLNVENQIQEVDLILNKTGTSYSFSKEAKNTWVTRVRARADEVLTLCLIAKARFFATAEFMTKSRFVNVQMHEMLIKRESEKTSPATQDVAGGNPLFLDKKNLH
jgi:hypothetical protein